MKVSIQLILGLELGLAFPRLYPRISNLIWCLCGHLMVGT